MTSNTSPLLSSVDEMLLDAGETDAALRATLLLLGAFASLPVPEPRPELAALLSAQTTQLGRRRLRRRHRTAAAGLAVIAGMGLGVSGVGSFLDHRGDSFRQQCRKRPARGVLGGACRRGRVGAC
jgi:hypothetical protein